MTVSVAHLWRHPIKAHGFEALESVSLSKGQTMPWDRTWAIAHEGARMDGTAWAPVANFSRGARTPALMAVSVVLNEDTEDVTLSHPDQASLTVHPQKDAARLLDWVNALMSETSMKSKQVHRVPGRGMTDSDFASISINSLSSHAAVEKQIGTALRKERWRGNIWLDGLEAWDEVNWLGKTVRIGEAELHIQEQITRCKATMANPDTGKRDADTLGALRAFGHQEFGIYGVVTKAGNVAIGDTAEVL